jgi:hypothetical protein
MNVPGPRTSGRAAASSEAMVMHSSLRVEGERQCGTGGGQQGGLTHPIKAPAIRSSG